MRFTLAQLEAFYWVAKLGTARDASQHLNLSPPTVSLRIRDLENALDVRLFDRVRRGLHLTAAGVELLDRAQSVLGEADHISNIKRADEAVRGTLRLGAPDVFAIGCLPSLFDLLEQAHPYLRVEVRIGTSPALFDDLQERRIDLAFVVNPRETQQLQLVPLGYLERRWTASPKLNLKEPLRPRAIQHVPVLTTPPRAPMYSAVVDWFHGGGAEPNRIILCDSVYVIAQLVKRKVGISILPLPLIEAENVDGQLRVLDAVPSLTRSVMYAAHRRDVPNGNINAVIRLTRQTLRDSRLLGPL